MTKAEAIEAMMRGERVTHRHFSHDEWVASNTTGTRMELEDGVKCDPYEFWWWRQEDTWNDGYSIWEPQKQ